MKRFLRQIVVLVAVLLLLSLSIQLLIDRRIHNKTVSGYDNLDVTVGGYDLIFLGSSRCFVHFDPRLFEEALHLRAVNLGTNGHSDLILYRLRLLNYLARNKPPKVAILSFDPMNFPGSMEDHVQVGHKNNFARYAWCSSAVNAPIVNYFGFNVAEKYIPLYALLKYKLLWDCVTLSHLDSWAVYGYQRHDETYDTVAFPVDAPKKMKDYFDTSASSLEKLKRELVLIDSICTRHHTRFICIQTPVYKPIYNRALFSWPGRICSDLHIPFFDVNDEEIDDDLSCFSSREHMNRKGVLKMTAKLLSDSLFVGLFRQTGGNTSF